MKRLVAAALILCATAASASTPTTLQEQIVMGDGWVAWDVPIAAAAGSPCCFSDGRDASTRRGCDLDRANGNFGTRSDDPGTASALSVYARVEHGRIVTLRAFAATCPVTSTAGIRRLGDVGPRDSVDLVAAWADDSARGKRDLSDATAALAMHADTTATDRLAAFTSGGKPREQREQAVFWLGQARGQRGAEVVTHLAKDDPDPKFREHAVFALAQARVDDAYLRVHAIATDDADAHVRGQALFWMAQMRDSHARDHILSALRRDASAEVREQAVFALSQLDGEAADDALITVVSGEYPHSAKEKALFWLGQSGSQRALDYIDRVLAQGPAPGS